jgi:hypothetical protein
MSLNLKSLLPIGTSSLRSLEVITKIPDTSTRRQASRILINRHHERLGGLKGRIGLPMSDVLPRAGGGFVKSYSGGTIELMDFTTGPQGFQKFRAEVTFVGFRVVDTNDASADEPYFIIGITGQYIDGNTTFRTNIDSNQSVKSNNNVVLQQKITNEAVPPFVLSVTGMDHDSGDPDEAAAKVTKSLNDFSAKLTLALPLLGVNPTIGAYIQSFLNIFGGTAGDVISALLGMGDDLVGQNALQLFPWDADKQEWTTPKPRLHADFDVPHNVEMALNGADGGGYIAFLNVLLFNDTSVLVHPAP